MLDTLGFFSFFFFSRQACFCSFRYTVEWLMFRRDDSPKKLSSLQSSSRFCAQMTQKHHSGFPDLVLIHFLELTGQSKAELLSGVDAGHCNTELGEKMCAKFVE